MQKINFQNLPSTSTPVNATNLNAVQTNVEDVFNGTVPMGNIKVDTVISKNLFNIDGEVNVRGNNGAIDVGVNVVSNNILTCGRNGDTDHALGQKFNDLNGKEITFSAKVLSIGTGAEGALAIYDNGSLAKMIMTNTINTFISTTYTCTSNNIVCGFFTTQGTGAQFTEIQVELGDTRTPWAKYQILDIPANSLFSYLNLAQDTSDLDTALIIGQYAYNPNTLHSPYQQIGTTDQYGLVFVLSNTANVSSIRWVFQIALTTWGNIFIRNNINNGGWSSWLKVHYQ